MYDAYCTAPDSLLYVTMAIRVKTFDRDEKTVSLHFSRIVGQPLDPEVASSLLFYYREILQEPRKGQGHIATVTGVVFFINIQ
jgi:hypothetical protein